MAAGVVQNLFIPHLIYENRFLWWKRGGKVIANFCSTNKFCGFTGSRSSSLQRNPTNSIMRWCCSSIEYAVSTFHTEFMSFFLFLYATKFSSCFILAKFSPFQAALYINSSSPLESLRLFFPVRKQKYHPISFFSCPSFIVHNCTIFFCSLDVRNRWSMQRSQYKGERSSCWVGEAVIYVLAEFVR